MKESKQNTKTEKEMEVERRRRYKEDLDLMIQLKLKNKENYGKNKPSMASLKNMEVCQVLEKEEQDYLKQLQKESFKKALVSQFQAKQNQEEKAKEDKRTYNQHLQESLFLQKCEQDQKRELKLKEINEFKNHYNDHKNMKKQKEMDDEKANKDYFIQEQQFRTKLEHENKEFLEKIRAERRRISNVIGCYQAVNNEVILKNKLIDQAIVEKGYLDKQAKELEKEKNELEKLRSQKNDVNQTLLKQIENNRIKGELLKYENLKSENELLVKEMNFKKDLDNKTKLERQKTIQTMMKTLEIQIKEREKKLLGDNFLTLNEEEYNCYLKKPDGLLLCPEKTTESIPGFCVQQDRKKMNEIADLNLKRSDEYLKKAIKNPNIFALEKDRSSNRIGELLKQNYSPSCDNLNKTRRQFASEYDFLRYKNWHKNFNILSNNPC